MYTCNRCKLNFENDPARVTGRNYALKFCATCSEYINERTIKKVLVNAAEVAAINRCKWCDSPLNEKNRSKAKSYTQDGREYSVNVCVECDAYSSNRRWLERCLTNSETLLNFVDSPKRRGRWKQIRKEKQLRERRDTLPLIEKAVESQATPQNNDALKSLLLQLVDALNSVK